VVRLHVPARRDLLGLETGQRAAVGDLARKADRVDRYLARFGGRKEIVQDRRVRTRVGALDAHMADALRAHDGDAVREARPFMQRAAEAVGADWRDVKMQVRRFLRGVAARESAKLG